MARALDDVDVGQLTKRVRIEQLVTTLDGQGGRSASWALRAVVWASVEPLTAREAVEAAAVTSALHSAITIWYRSDVAITDRLLLGTRTFQIESFQDPSGQQVALRLICVEAQNAPPSAAAVVPSWVQSDFVQ